MINIDEIMIGQTWFDAQGDAVVVEISDGRVHYVRTGETERKRRTIRTFLGSFTLIPVK